MHSQEKALLSRQDIEQLINAPSADDAFRMLADRGWGSPDLPFGDPDALVNAETHKTWDFISGLIGDLDSFHVFRFGNDYHNLKAAIKLEYSPTEDVNNDHFFIDYGTVDIEKIKKAASDHDFSTLPDEMAEAGRKAYETLAHTSSGQACDMVIDRAALVAISNAGKKSDSLLLRKYAELTVDSANIKTAVRSALMNKDAEFIRRAVAPAGSLDTNELINAASIGIDAIYSFLDKTAYSDAVDELKQSMSAFERWCDNQLIEMIRPQRYNYFGVEPMAAFILGRENEIRMVRLVLSAKINGLGSGAITERLRDMYV